MRTDVCFTGCQLQGEWLESLEGSLDHLPDWHLLSALGWGPQLVLWWQCGHSMLPLSFPTAEWPGPRGEHPKGPR